MTQYGRWTLGLAAWLLTLTAVSARNTAAAAPPVVQGELLTAPPKTGDKAAKPDKKKADDKDEDGVASKRIRWGKKKNESNEDYDKRFARVLNKIKKDKKGDYSGGQFVNEKGEIQMWTYMGHPFIVRTDVDKEFTANTAMYMEMLHREYGAAYRALLGGVTADLREPIEVIVFSDQKTYAANGGPPGSGGFFMAFGHLVNDRMKHWKARRYRLQQFTGGTKDFAKWEKGTLKHEAAHMEIQLRLGNTLIPGYNIGIPIRAPRWFNEGHASVFEWWDFDKTAEENLADIPNKGRYAPVIRRTFGTDRWKDFDYIWTIDDQTWSNDMTSAQGYLNYCQAWSLAGYMMGGGVKGKRDFQAVFGLSRKVGTDRQTTLQGDRKIAWEEKFPPETKKSLEENWTKWVAENVSQDKVVPDEEFMLKENGINPAVTDRLEFYEGDERKAIREWVEAEKDRREKDPNRVEY